MEEFPASKVHLQPATWLDIWSGLFLDETTEITIQYNFLLTTWRKNLTSSWKEEKEFLQ